MATVKFKAKTETISIIDAGQVIPGRTVVKVPKFRHHHCDMAAFRQHKRIGDFANSDMFLSMVDRGARALGVKGFLDIDNPPTGVMVDTSGFLAVVTFEL